MAAIAIQEVPAGGLDSVTFAAANTSDTVARTNADSKRMAGYSLSELLLIYKNSDATTEAITVGSLAPVTIPATTGMSIIPVPDEGINDASVTITMASATGITVACVRIGGSY